jgi:hypothetical protein
MRNDSPKIRASKRENDVQIGFWTLFESFAQRIFALPLENESVDVDLKRIIAVRIAQLETDRASQVERDSPESDNPD